MTKLLTAGLALALLPAMALAQARELIPVVSKPVSRKLELPGELQPFLRVDVRARVAGYVEKVLVDRGSAVKEGELLAELSAPEMKAQILEAESKVQISEAERIQAQARIASAEAALTSLQSTLASAQSTYDRLKAAAQTPGAISGNELEIAQRNVESQRSGLEAQRAVIQAQRAGIDVLGKQTATAQAAVRVLKEMEGYLRVTAPFDGVITERLVHPGAIVGPGATAAILRLEQLSHLRLVVAVPEANVGSITKNATVEFQVPAFPERTFSGTIARLSQSLDEKTRSMPVEVDVNNKDGALTPGMYASVKWPVRSSQPSLYVPKTSVVSTTERTFVIREKNGRAEWVDVKKLASEGDQIQVMGTLQAGDRIVRQATDEIRDGAPLQIQTKSAPPAPPK